MDFHLQWPFSQVEVVNTYLPDKELVIAKYQKTWSWNGITIKGNGKATK